MPSAREKQGDMIKKSKHFEMLGRLCDGIAMIVGEEMKVWMLEVGCESHVLDPAA